MATVESPGDRAPTRAFRRSRPDIDVLRTRYNVLVREEPGVIPTTVIAAKGAVPVVGRLSEQDLVPDQSLRREDEDAFNHEAIAVTLADLVLVADAPLNVALFGRWGSGKSSIYELLRREVRKHDDEENIALVRYDAWKYGGESLQRNFISFAASKLGFKDNDNNRNFHRGLYEKRRGVEIRFASVPGRSRWERLTQSFAPLWLFAWVFGALVVVFSLLVGLASLATDENFLGQIAKTLPGFLVSTGGVAVLVAGAKVVMDGVTTDVEQSQPSAEEQFSETFDELVRRTKAEKKKTRLVFFIDELDRCSPDDVVATLTGIKTFLDHEDCVFIVAADREVLECALEKLPQSTPYDEQNPYYSSASSFFDKVFQHQMPLPPLRGQRLTKFARDIVRGRGGLWGELRDADPSGRLLDRVVYVLVPSHVRSPRRVKVLLNAFATNVRIAEGRGIDWLSRALQLAKLTAIQTEFPLLASDLHNEPRLPEFLLEAPPKPSRRVAALLTKYGEAHVSSDFVGGAVAPTDAPGRGDDDDEAGVVKTHVTELELEAAQPTDLPLNSASRTDREASARSALVGMQHAWLRRYLERTADVEQLGRDLLFLEAAGAAVGLEDGALGELLETDAPESPLRVIEAMEERGVSERIQVVRVLAAMSEDEFGEERKNVMTALLGVAKLVGEPLGEAGHTAVAAVNSFETEQRLGENLLLDALALGVAAKDVELVERVGQRADLLATRSRVRKAAGMLDRLPEAIAWRVHARLAEEMADGPDLLIEALMTLPRSAASSLYFSEAVRNAVVDIIESEEDDGAFVEQLVSTVSGHEALAKDVQGQLLRSRHRYDTAWLNAAVVRESLTPAEANDHALLALDYAPVEHWPEWTTYLAPTVPGSATYASYPAARLVGEGADADPDAAIEVLTVVAPFLNDLKPEAATRITDALAARLNSATWWDSDESLASQETSHRLARVLLTAADQALVDSVVQLLEEDVDRPRLVAESVGTPVAGAAAVKGLRRMGARLPSENVVALYEAWSQASVESSEPVQQQLIVALLRLAAVAQAAGEAPDTSQLTVDRILELPDRMLRRSRLTPVEDWLSLGPELDAVVRLLVTKGPSNIGKAVQQYCNGLPAAKRTALAESLFHAGAHADWLEIVGEQDVDDDALTQVFVSAVLNGTTDAIRTQLAQYIVALKPTTGPAQKALAGLIIELVDSGKTGRFETAQRLLCVLKPNHRSTKPLRDAFVRAADHSNLTLPPRRAKELEAANVTLPKKALPKKTLLGQAVKQAKNVLGSK